MAVAATEPLMDRIDALTDQVAGVMGVLNAGYGRLVELIGRGLDDGLLGGWGIHSPAHWVAWQTGLSSGRAAGLVRLAERRTELPSAVAALVAGELSVDAAVEIAKRAPAAYEASITAFAKDATVTQLRRCLRGYRYDDDAEQSRPKPREDERSVSTGTDDQGWWIRGRLPADEGAVVDQALRTAREDLYQQSRANTPEGERPPLLGLADGLVGAAEAFLRHGQTALPGSDRYQVLLHLEAAADPTDPVGILSVHQGPAVPDAIRRLLLCDCTTTPVWQRHGTPVSVGRRQRLIGRRLRRLIEHRDGGCRTPGCGSTLGTEIHHIHHWEDGGGTDTHNLVTLCRKHHRLHHLGHLGITGNPEVPTGEPDALTFTDKWGHALRPCGRPTTPQPGKPLEHAATDAGITPGDYTHPLGERLDPRAVSFAPNPAPPPHPNTLSAAMPAVHGRPEGDGDVALRTHVRHHTRSGLDPPATHDAA